MARGKSSRKWQVTINNPTEHGFSHEVLKNILRECTSALYWCMCDEIGESGTPHTHIYIVFKNGVMFSTMQQRFYGAHLEMANGSNQDNRDYIRKEGKWLDDKKHETNLTDTFEEWGELPPDRKVKSSFSEEVLAMIEDGCSNYEILHAHPSALHSLSHIERARQIILESRYKDQKRKITTSYIWGDTGSGKTRRVMDEYGYSNVYRVTDYEHPFDGYNGQAVIMFEEFRSSLPIADMLKYLDIYPLELPCRYANKIACYTEVFLVSNIPLEKQYPHIQQSEPETWKAFLRRVDYIEHKVAAQSTAPHEIAEML